MFNKKVYELTLRIFDEVIEELVKKSEEFHNYATMLDTHGEDIEIEAKCMIRGKANKYMEASNYLKRQEIKYMENMMKILEKENADLREVINKNGESNN